MAIAPTKKVITEPVVTEKGDVVTMPEPVVRGEQSNPLKGEATQTEIKGVTHILMAG